MQNRKKAAKWRGYYDCPLLPEDLDHLYDNPTVSADSFWRFSKEAVDLGYSVSVRAFGYKATYVARLYGKYADCPNAGIMLTAEAMTIETAMAALIRKVERIGLYESWPFGDTEEGYGIF
jgi:hypothetical protein